jgi:hypothetical protein
VLQPKVPSIVGKPSVKTAQDESDSSEDEESDSEDDKKPAGKLIAKVRSLVEIARIIKMFYKFLLAWHSSFCSHIACLYPYSLLKMKMSQMKMSLMKRVQKNNPRLQRKM